MEVFFFFVEVIFDECQSERDFFQRFDGIFPHGMNLETLANIKTAQLDEVISAVFFLQVGFIQMNGHGMAQNGHAMIELDDILFVQIK